MNRTLWRVFLRYTLVSTLAFVSIISRPETILAQGEVPLLPGSSCSNALPVAINPVNPPVFNLASGEQHYFLISIPGLPSNKSHLTVSTAGFLPTRGLLLDKGGIPVNTETIYGGVFPNFRFSEYLVPGAYCIRVRGHDSSVIGLYQLKIQGDLFDDDFGSDLPSAKVIRSNLTLAKLSVPNDWDFFRIEVKPGGGTVQVETEGFLPTRGILLVEPGIPVNTEAIYGGVFPNFRFSVDLPQGRYYVRVRGHSSADQIGDYRLKVTGPVVFPTGTCAGLKATHVGTDGPDIINGTPGNDVIQALGGNDIVNGLGGNDVICGGVGDDVLNGGSGVDRLYGDQGNDILIGESGNDFLYGGDGNDVLIGGLGTDIRIGGLNKDVCDRDATEAIPDCEVPFSVP